MNPQELLQTYSENAQAFITAARSIPEAKVNLSPAEGEWSAAYVIHHMADAELQFGVRYANALAAENPAIVAFDETKFPAALHYEKRSVGNSIAAFEAAHNLSYEILKSASPEDWNRTSVHPEKGRVYLTSLVKLCGNHIGMHIEQLKEAGK